MIDQQFEVAQQILDHGLVPIIEPEVTISIPGKADAEDDAEHRAHRRNSTRCPKIAEVMLKLTLPETPNLYAPDSPRIPA